MYSPSVELEIIRFLQSYGFSINSITCCMVELHVTNAMGLGLIKAIEQDNAEKD